MESSNAKIQNVAKEINQLHLEFCGGLRKLMVEKAVRIGELLIAQKKECGHGEWYPWIKANLIFAPVTAARYVRCFHHRAMIANRSPGTDMTIHDLARITAKPSEQELEQIQARQKRLQEKANAIAKERIELNKKAAKLQKEQEEEEVIEVEEVEFEPFTDEDESEEEFEERVQEEMKFLRKHLTDERQGKTVQRFVQVYWDILTKRYPTKWKKNAAKAILKFLLKKYPQLMDEGI